MHILFLYFVDSEGILRHLAFVQYSFARKEHERHPTSWKLQGTFQHSKPGTLKLTKASVAEKKRPLKVLKEVENSQGGVIEVKLSCDLPWDEAKHQKSSIPTGMPRSDTLAHVMRECKESSSASETYIHSAQAATEPMCVLATNQQLSDLQSFCTASPSSILLVDPTSILDHSTWLRVRYREVVRSWEGPLWEVPL